MGALVLDPAKLAPGFERALTFTMLVFIGVVPGKTTSPQSGAPRGSRLSHVVAWLKKRPRALFLWIHLYDPHDPHTAGALRHTLSGRAIRRELPTPTLIVGKLLAELRARDLFDGSIIAVMADHGEAFGEHGETHHGIFSYDETIHIPLRCSSFHTSRALRKWKRELDW